MTHLHRLSVLACAVIVSVVIGLLGCNSKSGAGQIYEKNPGGPETQGLTSQVGSSGSFIDRAQKDTPFRIVVPSYLPSNLFPRYIAPPMKGADGGIESGLVLIYGAGGDDTEGLIEIHEWGYPVGPPDPKLNTDYQSFLIQDTEVVRTRHNKGFLTSDGPVNHPGYLFYWNQNEVYFEVGIYHYDYAEAIKVIESMIQEGQSPGSPTGTS